jgi:competence protein ComEC
MSVSRPYFQKPIPLLRPLLGFGAGIFTGWHYPLPVFFLLITTVALFVLLFFVNRCQWAIRSHWLMLAGVAYWVLFFSLGQWVTHRADLRHHADWYGNQFQPGDSLCLRLLEPPEEKKKTYKADCQVEYLIRGHHRIKVSGTLPVYFRKEDRQKQPVYGSQFVIHKPPQPIQPAGNPGDFDLVRYRAFHQQYHQLFLNASDISWINESPPTDCKTYLFAWRDWILRHLKNRLPTDDGTLGVAEALLIGYRVDLDPAVLQAYSQTGVIHIIAISGLHLGLIYVALTWLFSQLPFVRNALVWRGLLVLFCLWIFSLLTGASASVLRSAVMFTCIVVGSMVQKKSSLPNMLAASAFLLLWYNPYLLWDVGFQLSYAALVGIGWLQKRLAGYLKSNYFLLNKVGEMASVTIAAQITTWPLCLYYFHQFPLYFLPVNLIVVPFSTALLFGEILMLITTDIAPINSWITWLVKTGLQWMNAIVTWFADLPGGLITNIHFPDWSVCLAILMLIAMDWFIERRCPLWIIWLAVFFGVFRLHDQWVIAQQRGVVLHQSKRGFSMDVLSGFSFVHLCSDTSSFATTTSDPFKGPRHHYGLSENPLKRIHLPSQHIRMTMNGRPMLLLNTQRKQLPDTLTGYHWIMLLGEPPTQWLTRIAQAKPSLVIFIDLPLWKIDRWRSRCQTVALPHYFLATTGALELFE